MNIDNAALGVTMNQATTVTTVSSLPESSTVTVGYPYYISSIGVLAFAAGSNWLYSDLPEQTWAEILAISSEYLETGMRVCCTSFLERPYFEWNGSSWVAANDIHLIQFRTITTLSGSTSTSDQLVTSTTIPANLLGDYGCLYADIKCGFSAESTNSKSIAMSVGTSSSSTNTADRLDSTSASNYGLKGRLIHMMDNGTTQYRFSGLSNINNPYSGSAGTFTLDQTADIYCAINCKIALSTESIIVYGVDLYAKRGV